MARMLPTHISGDVKSRAEKRVFDLLRDDPDTGDWTCLHSLALARHVNQRYGEIDFVILVPDEGVFCLEVKGGRVRCRDGEWQFQNRYGDVSTRRKGPFLQARDGMFSMVAAIREHFGEHSRLSDVLYGYGVLFPDIEWEHGDPEHEPWQVFDRSCRVPISGWIRELARHTGLRQPTRLRPTVSDIRGLTRFLRPDFEYITRPADQLSQAEEDILRLTEEQYRTLDMLDGNPRLLVDGAAGTGKTLLAIEYARRSARDGKRTLLLCYNRLLANWICTELAGPTDPPAISTGSFHLFLERELIAKSSQRDEFNQRRATATGESHDAFFREDYPLFALGALAEGVLEPVDVLVIDEGQDLIRPEYLDVFDEVLRGGLAGGRWVIFSDFQRQAIFAADTTEAEMRDELDRRAQYASARLTVNCRNTRPIGEETALLSGFAVYPFLPSRVEGIPVQYGFYKNTRQERRMLTEVLQSLLGSGIPPGGITVLSPVRRENSCLSAPLDDLSVPIEDLKGDVIGRHPAAITFSTIHAFKGLENSVIILADIEHISDERNRPLLYIGMSRARHRLFVLLSNSAQDEYAEALRRKFGQTGASQS